MTRRAASSKPGYVRGTFRRCTSTTNSGADCPFHWRQKDQEESEQQLCHIHVRRPEHACEATRQDGEPCRVNWSPRNAIQARTHLCGTHAPRLG